KGLGAPVGAALAGTTDVIAAAWSVRKRFGGGMRQSGILAAGALHGLEFHLPRLAEDHELAREFASVVDGAGGARVVEPDTNIVMLDLPEHVNSADVIVAAAKAGVHVTPWSRSRIRAVMHLDVNREMVREAAWVVARAVENNGAHR
ncbi:MAG: beta-eliminating lyase-related protein, partial [Gemmatimonadaceae bacterium]